jgi:hypothetical protein
MATTKIVVDDEMKVYYIEIAAVLTLLVVIASSWTYTFNGSLRLHRKPLRSANLCSGVKLLSVSSQDDSSILKLTSNTDIYKANETILEFISIIKESIENDQFVAFTLHGPSKDSFRDISEARGYVRVIKGRSIILSNKVVIQATFKYHGATDICKNWSPKDCRKNLEAILLSTTTSDVIPVSEWGTSLPTTFGLPHGIKNALLETSNATNWELKTYRGSVMLRPHQGKKANRITTDQHLKHDRNKYTFVDLSNPVWLALGVTSSLTGTVKQGMSSKLRQCQKFVEIVDKLVSGVANNSGEPQNSSISVVDMGCGRGYLTFALHSYLHRYYGEQISSRGIEVRPKLVKEISAIASDLGTEFERLRFEVGTIESFLAESPSEPRASRSIEVIIALHACDTASDDALWSGIYRNSDIIVVAPCCHRELRPQLDQHVRSNEQNEHPYIDILRHNIYRERMAETLTDSMRALLLELSGYTVQVFEFIGGEHTSKNVMITAVKNKKMTSFINGQKDEVYWRRLDRLQSLAKLHGIEKHKLATWIGVTLSYNPVNDSFRPISRPMKMPPLQR